jgi:hypothetical protein
MAKLPIVTTTIHTINRLWTVSPCQCELVAEEDWVVLADTVAATVVALDVVVDAATGAVCDGSGGRFVADAGVGSDAVTEI